MRKKKRLFGCTECGSDVRMTSGPGRTCLIRRGVELPIPDDFETPVCESCGNSYGIPEVSERLDVVMREVEAKIKSDPPKLTKAKVAFLKKVVTAVADGKRGVMAGKGQSGMVCELAAQGFLQVVDTIRTRGDFKHVYSLTVEAAETIASALGDA